MSKLFNYLASTLSMDGYKALFKGSIALSTLYLVSLMQVGNMTLPIEKSANELRYTVEYSLQKQYDSIDKMECKLKDSSYKDCKVAKYQNNLVNSNLNALIAFQNLLMYLASIFFMLSVIGFLAHPYIHNENEAP